MSKILVVDDDIAINELIKVNLDIWGYDVINAYDGIQGFTLAKQEAPDLIILDVMMPDVDGYTVAKRVRENVSTKNIPILMLTAMGQLEDKVKGFDIGVDDYLVKPFEMEELKVRVRALLKRVNAIPESLATKDILTVGDITLLPEIYSLKIAEKTGAEKTIQIVTTLRQNALLGFVSKESPLGRALMGKKEGERSLVEVSDTMKYYVKVLKIEKGEDNSELPISEY